MQCAFDKSSYKGHLKNGPEWTGKYMCDKYQRKWITNKKEHKIKVHFLKHATALSYF